MKMCKIAISCMALAFALNTQAATFSDTYTQCMNKSEGITANMLDCMSSEISYQDKLLNMYYKKAKAVLDKKGQKLLLNEQRAWLKYRDARTAFISGTAEGSMGTLQTQSTFLEMLGNRVDELKEIYSE